VMTSMMTSGGSRKSLEIPVPPESPKRKPVLSIWMTKRMKTRTMMATCLNMTCGEMMRKHQQMLKMAKRILNKTRERNPAHLLDQEVGHTLGTDPETRRKGQRGLGHLAPPAVLGHQDQEVEAAGTEGGINQGRKKRRVVESALDLAQGGNHEEAEALLRLPAAAPGPDRDMASRKLGDAHAPAQVAVAHAQGRDQGHGGPGEGETGQGFSFFYLIFLHIFEKMQLNVLFNFRHGKR